MLNIRTYSFTKYNLLKIVCLFGSVIEWYDFALYGFLGVKFIWIFSGKMFHEHWISIFLTYAIFSIGFLCRPIGAIIFGYLGDKYGRIFVLRSTIFLITIITTLIAFIPTYDSIGIASLIIFIILRSLQGILLGGEFTGNMVFLCESSKRKKYFWGSLASCTGSLGIMLASFIVSLFLKNLPLTFMYTYGWRIAFLLLVPFGIIVFIIRLLMNEPEEFVKQIKSEENPILLVCKQYKSILLICIAMISLHAVSYTYTFIFIPAFLRDVRHLNDVTVLANNSLFMLIHIILIPLFGAIINTINGKKILFINALLFVFLSIVLSWYIVYGEQIKITISLFILSGLTSLNSAIFPAILIQILPTNIRFLVVSIVYNIGFGIIGGTVPFICMYLTKSLNSLIAPGFYLFLWSFITLIVTWVFFYKKVGYYECVQSYN